MRPFLTNILGLSLGVAMAPAAWGMGKLLWPKAAQPARISTESWGAQVPLGGDEVVAWDGKQPLVFYLGHNYESAEALCAGLQSQLEAKELQKSLASERVPWSARPLFSVADQEDSTDPQARMTPHGELRRYCLVTAGPAGDRTSAQWETVLFDLYEDQSAGDLRVAPALPVLLPAATDTKQRSHATGLLAQEVGKFELPGGFDPTREAAVTVIDTELTAFQIQERPATVNASHVRSSAHGYSLAHLVDYLACSPFVVAGQAPEQRPMGCPVTVGTRLGLSQVK